MWQPDLDLLVLGSGVAGLSAVVRAAVLEPGMRVGVLSKGELSQSATQWAQGGVAAVLAERDGDSPGLHAADTMAAGADLCDGDAVGLLVGEGPARVRELVELGAVFDRDGDGGLALGREGGHSMARVVHAGGAATGAEIERALVSAVRRQASAVWEGWFAAELVVEGGRCRGVRARDADGRLVEVRAAHTLLATGGAGQLFALTTNPLQSTGDGLAMALRAGVPSADVEFVQFHPTALALPAMPRPLLSEALRGEGALLRDRRGERFVDELSPRDVVSAAMTGRMLEQGVDHLWLDVTGIDAFAARFPTLAGSLRAAGLDPASDWLPVAPAAHYLCGGVLTDLDGASALPGLWAAGEAACSGVHGANRLASNSLLEGMVFGARVVEAIGRGKGEPEATGALRPLLAGWPEGTAPASEAATIGTSRLPRPPVPPLPRREQRRRRRQAPGGAAAPMTAGAGVLRTAASLEDLAGRLGDTARDLPGTRDGRRWPTCWPWRPPSSPPLGPAARAGAGTGGAISPTVPHPCGSGSSFDRHVGRPAPSRRAGRGRPGAGRGPRRLRRPDRRAGAPVGDRARRHRRPGRGRPRRPAGGGRDGRRRRPGHRRALGRAPTAMPWRPAPSSPRSPVPSPACSPPSAPPSTCSATSPVSPP